MGMQTSMYQKGRNAGLWMGTGITATKIDAPLAWSSVAPIRNRIALNALIQAGLTPVKTCCSKPIALTQRPSTIVEISHYSRFVQYRQPMENPNASRKMQSSNQPEQAGGRSSSRLELGIQQTLKADLTRVAIQGFRRCTA